MSELSRRGFLQSALLGGGALVLAACGGNRAWRIEHADQTGDLVANLYISVLANGRVALIVNKAEIGQGVSTGYATMVADEIGARLDHVDVEFAGSNKAMRGSANMQLTGGSTSTAEAFEPLRRAAASAREMLIAAAAEQWRVPPGDCHAIDGDVVHGSDRLSFGELTKRAARLEVPKSPRLKSASEFTLIGKVDRRVDVRGKVDGSARYGIDVTVPGMVNAFAIHGPVFGAKPISVRADAAKRRPGVIDVIAFSWGVAIVADKFWQARAAAADVEVTWDRGAAAGLDSTELARAMREHRTDGGHVTKHDGDVRDALDHGMDDVTVHVTLCGGGFGRRAIGDSCAQAAQISQRVNRPVKLTWTRESDMTQAWYRPVYAVKVEGAVRGGKVTGARIHSLSQSLVLSGQKLLGAALSQLPTPVAHMIADAAIALFATNSVGDVFASEGIQNTPYRFGSFELAVEPVQTKLPVSFWRSVGNSVTGFVIEGLVDELAVAAKQDPFTLRRALLPPDSKQTRVLDAVERLSSWAKPAPAGIGRGLARHFAFETEVAQVVEVELVDNRIKVRRVYCVVDCGTVINPDIVKAQMEGAIIFGLSAALDQEITLVDGVVQQRNYDRFPLLRMFEAPEIVVQILPSDHKPTGVGEPGLPPVAPAVANAIHQLTGVRLRRLPLQRAWNERGGA